MSSGLTSQAERHRGLSTLDLALPTSHVYVMPICGVGIISSIDRPQGSLLFNKVLLGNACCLHAQTTWNETFVVLQVCTPAQDLIYQADRHLFRLPAHVSRDTQRYMRQPVWGDPMGKA